MRGLKPSEPHGEHFHSISVRRLNTAARPDRILISRKDKTNACTFLLLMLASKFQVPPEIQSAGQNASEWFAPGVAFEDGERAEKRFEH